MAHSVSVDSSISTQKCNAVIENSPNLSLSSIGEYLSASCKHFARWMMVDHPNLWADILPSCLVPVPATPFNHPKELFASDEDQKKVAALFKGRTLEEYYKIQSFTSLTLRGSYIFTANSMPGVVIKAYIPKEDKLLMKRDFNPFQTGLPPLQWYGKGSICGRALMAERLMSFIDAQGLDRLYVPKKRISPISQKPDAEKVILAEKLDLMSKTEGLDYLNQLPQEEREEIYCQFFTLVFHNGCSDLFFGGNVTFIKSGEHQGKLAIIDTEPLGLDEIHAGTHLEDISPLEAACGDPDISFSKDESGGRVKFSTDSLYRNIYLAGGKRNLDLAMGWAAAHIFVSNNVKDDALNVSFAKVKDRYFSEFKSNFKKAWALRLLFPATVMASIAIPMLQRYLENNRRVR